jgi:N-acyl homoserine lactone hydrolase
VRELEDQAAIFQDEPGLGDLYEVPVPCFLITHPRGNVLFDGGNALEMVRNARTHWGNVVEDTRDRKGRLK